MTVLLNQPLGVFNYSDKHSIVINDFQADTTDLCIKPKLWAS